MRGGGGVLKRVLGLLHRVLGLVCRVLRGTTQGTRGTIQGTGVTIQGIRGNTLGSRGNTQGTGIGRVQLTISHRFCSPCFSIAFILFIRFALQTPRFAGENAGNTIDEHCNGFY